MAFSVVASVNLVALVSLDTLVSLADKVVSLNICKSTVIKLITELTATFKESQDWNL